MLGPTLQICIYSACIQLAHKGWSLKDSEALHNEVCLHSLIPWGTSLRNPDSVSSMPSKVQRNRKSCSSKPKPAAPRPHTAAKYDKGCVLNVGGLSWYLMASSHLDGRLAGSLSPLVFPNKPPATRTLAHLEEKRQIAVEKKKRGRETRWD